MNWEYISELIRKAIIVIATFCGAFFHNTTGFLIALILTFALHIWAGMGADKVKLKWRWGVPPAYLQNFEIPKFTIAMIDLFVIISLTYLIKGIADLNNYEGGSHYIVQLFFMIANYVYLRKGLENLIKKYPRNIVLRIFFALITLKFKEIVGEETYKTIEQEIDKEEKKNE